MRRRALVGLLAPSVCACTLMNPLDGFHQDDAPPIPATSSTSPTDPLTPPSPADDAGATAASVMGAPASSPATLIVAFGGQDANRTYSPIVYVARVGDDGSLEWKTSTPLPDARMRMPAAVVGNRIVAAGGDAPSGLRADCLVATLDGTGLGAFQRTTMGMPAGRFRHGMVAYGQRLYVVGGLVSSIAQNEVWASSPSTSVDGWSSAATLPEPRSGAVVVTSGPHLYVVAGAHPADGGNVQAGDGWSADIAADGSLGAWHAIPKLPGIVTESGMGAATATHVYVSGGYANVAYSYVEYASVAADGSLGAWAAAPSLATGRAGGAMVVANGRLYVLGGQTAANVNVASVEVADIHDDGSLSPWREAAPMPGGVAFHAAAVVTAP